MYLQKNKIALSLLGILSIFMFFYFLIPVEAYNGQTYFHLKVLLTPVLWSFLFLVFIKYNKTYLIIVSYFIFIISLLSEFQNFGVLQTKDIFVYAFFTVSLAFILSFISQSLHVVKRSHLPFLINLTLAISTLIIPLLFLLYKLNYGTKISEEILNAFFQTNLDESFEHLIDFVQVKWLFIFLFSLLIIAFLLFKHEKNEVRSFKVPIIILPIILFFSVNIFSFSSSRIHHFITTSANKYFNELELFNQVQEKLKTGDIHFEATKEEEQETYVFIIGESLNKRHMSLYGYPRNTTPNLLKLAKNNELIVFKNAYSNHTHTVEVLSLALTEANQLNQKTYYESLSLLDILNKADFETHWLTNQNLKGIYDNMVSVVAAKADYLIGINNSIGGNVSTQNYDNDLLPKLKKALARKTTKNKAIFIHLMGNHGYYCARYPDEFNVFTNSLDKESFGQLYPNEKTTNNINCYDNSVLYNDKVVGNIIDEVKKERGVRAIFYMSDHADDVFHQLGHNSEKFTYEMTQIPMVGWFSSEYKEKHFSQYETLKSHTNKLFSNDFYYETVLGITNTKTERYQSKYDLSSPGYHFLNDSAFTLHRKKKYTGDKNHLWWQQENTNYLIKTKQSSRIFPHRVNSIGKLKSIWDNGFRSFELDVVFDGEKFVIGHPKNKTIHDGYFTKENAPLMWGNLEEYLSEINHIEVQRFWLDLKNLNATNYLQITKRLDYLNQKFNIKEKVIIESGTNGSKEFDFLNQMNWHASYYCPTTEILELLKQKNVRSLQLKAKEIAYKCTHSSLSAVSFDHSLYPFIKTYLEPLITNDIVYHAWMGPLLSSPNFKTELEKNLLFKDKRVKTLLCGYLSNYNL